jgi:hypothetical protein
MWSRLRHAAVTRAASRTTLGGGWILARWARGGLTAVEALSLDALSWSQREELREALPGLGTKPLELRQTEPLSDSLREALSVDGLQRAFEATQQELDAVPRSERGSDLLAQTVFHGLDVGADGETGGFIQWDASSALRSVGLSGEDAFVALTDGGAPSTVGKVNVWREDLRVAFRRAVDERSNRDDNYVFIGCFDGTPMETEFPTGAWNKGDTIMLGKMRRRKQRPVAAIMAAIEGAIAADQPP